MPPRAGTVAQGLGPLDGGELGVGYPDAGGVLLFDKLATTDRPVSVVVVRM